MISDFLAFESGLFLTTKGMKWDDNWSGADFKSKASLHYLDIPLTLKATYDLSENIKWGSDEDENEDDDDLGRLDMGFTFGAGVEINSIIIIGISYDLGLYNISSYQDYGTTSQNRVLKFSVGYILGN